jgi:hypothetical protein
LLGTSPSRYRSDPRRELIRLRITVASRFSQRYLRDANTLNGRQFRQLCDRHEDVDRACRPLEAAVVHPTPRGTCGLSRMQRRHRSGRSWHGKVMTSLGNSRARGFIYGQDADRWGNLHFVGSCQEYGSAGRMSTVRSAERMEGAIPIVPGTSRVVGCEGKGCRFLTRGFWFSRTHVRAKGTASPLAAKEPYK